MNKEYDALKDPGFFVEETKERKEQIKQAKKNAQKFSKPIEVTSMEYMDILEERKS